MLALVRHATTDWSGRRYCGRTDIALSAAGRAQLAPLAAFLGSAIRDRPTVISSPALRCRETAEAIAERLGCAIEPDDRIREIDFGDAEGATFPELEHRWPPLAAMLLREDADLDWPAGERGADFAARVRSAWHDLGERSADTVVVTHGGPLRAMVGLAFTAWPAGLPQRLDPADAVLLVHGAEWVLDRYRSARIGAPA